MAPFNARVAEVLARKNTPYQIDTLGSIARSLEAGRYEPSNRVEPTSFEPLDKGGAAIRIAAWPLGAFAAMFLFKAFGPICQSACRLCAQPTVWEGQLYAGGFALFFLALRVGPGLWAMRGSTNAASGQPIIP